MQITQGTATVNYESNVVTAAGVDWSTVGSFVGQAIFVGGDVGHKVGYVISGVSSPITLLLATPYMGGGGGGPQTFTYSISVDFTSHGLPLINPGDVDTAVLWQRAMILLDALL